MTTKTVRIDDFDNETEEEVREVLFTIDGSTYTIDLGPESLSFMWETMEGFVQAGRLIKAPAVTKNRPKRTLVNKEIREWAESNGFELAARGRIPVAVVEAYDQAVLSNAETQIETPVRARNGRFAPASAS